MYPIHLDVLGAYDGNAAAVARHARVQADDAERLGAALVVTEVGVPHARGGAAAFLADAYDAFDDVRASAFHWEASGVSGYGVWDRERRRTPLWDAVARPYPARVAGEPLAWRWDRARREFSLRWREDETVRGDTVVVLPRSVFPAAAPPRVEMEGPFLLEGTRLRLPGRGRAGERTLRVTG